MAHLNSVIPKHIPIPLPAPSTCQVVAEFSLLRLMCYCGLRVKSRHSMEKSNAGPSDHLLMREKCQPHLPWMQDAVREWPDRERCGDARGCGSGSGPGSVVILKVPRFDLWLFNRTHYLYSCSLGHLLRAAATAVGRLVFARVAPRNAYTHTQRHSNTSCHTCCGTHMPQNTLSYSGLKWLLGFTLGEGLALVCQIASPGRKLSVRK